MADTWTAPLGPNEPTGNLRCMSQNPEASREVARTFARNALREDFGPQSLIRLAKKIRGLADGEIEGAAANSACRKGCAHCCRWHVTATLPEAVAIVRHVLDSYSDGDRQALTDRLAEHDAEAARYWKYQTEELRASCPFLVAGECSIYEARPLVCRGRNSRSAEACRDLPADASPLSIPRAKDVDETAGAWSLGVMQGMRDAGRPGGAFDLAGVVSALLGPPEALDDLETASNWLGRFRTTSELLDAPVPTTRVAQSIIHDPVLSKHHQLKVASRYLEASQVLTNTNDPIASLFDLALPRVYESEGDQMEWWERHELALSRLENANLDPKTAFDALPLANTFGLAYQPRDVTEFQRRRASFIANRITALAHPDLVAPFEGPRTPGKPRVGYISYRLKAFHGARWALGWLLGHSEEFETFAFNLYPTEDDVSARFRHAADHYRHLPLPAEQAGRIVRQADLDLLIFTDLGMSGTDAQMASMRLASWQATAWGHPITSGFPTIDFYLSSELMEPPDADAHYTERLIRLPNSGLHYPRALPPRPGKTREQYGLPNGHVVLNAQTVFKMSPGRDALWRELSERLENPIVFIQREGADGEIVKRRLQKAGVRVQWLTRLSRPDFMRVMQLADVLVDTPDWSGGNTTIEGLAMGKPVVTLPGRFMRGRHSLAFLNVAKVPRLIAKDEADFISLVGDPGRAEHAFQGVDPDALFEDPAPQEALNAFVRSLV